MTTQHVFHYSTADEVINAAKHIMESMMVQRDILLNSPDLVRQYLQLRLGKAEREIFCVMFLDIQNRLISTDDLFMGTIDGATGQVSIYGQKKFIYIKRLLHYILSIKNELKMDLFGAPAQVQ